MDNDDIRNINEEPVYFDDPNYIYQLETYDLPYGCPYRKMAPFPPQGPGFGPQGPGGGPQGPNSPPPNFTPSQGAKTQTFQGPGASTKFVDPGTIRPCTFRFVYIWPTRGRGFWAWLTYVGRRSVSGFRWNGNRWVYFGMDLRSIESFQCF